MRIKKGDTVYVRTGDDAGKTGRVLWVDTAKNQILVEGIARRKKHQRPTQQNPKGGIVSKEAPIHISNVALYNASTGGPVKFTSKVIDESGHKHRVRISKKTGEEI
jgi:large subunit ribosomal protein L24